jgi:hypothetical protein
VIPFRRIAGGLPRPLLDVYLDESLAIPQTCLIDTGAAGVRLSAELARAMGIALPEEPNGGDVVAGGVRSQAFGVDHELRLELEGQVLAWRAPVTFCDPWPHPFGLLGLDGFLDRFDLTLRGADLTFEISPH